MAVAAAKINNVPTAAMHPPLPRWVNRDTFTMSAVRPLYPQHRSNYWEYPCSTRANGTHITAGGFRGNLPGRKIVCLRTRKTSIFELTASATGLRAALAEADARAGETIRISSNQQPVKGEVP